MLHTPTVSECCGEVVAMCLGLFPHFKLLLLAIVGKYGLRVFDIYEPNKASVFRSYFLWRNANSGWTGTVIGRVGFDGFVSAENGVNIFESRATKVPTWDECYIKNSLFIDYTGFHLGYSLTAYDEFDYGHFTVMGGPCCDGGGVLLPWNEMVGGGMLISNCTWVNFKNPCLRYLPFQNPFLVLDHLFQPSYTAAISHYRSYS
jgi:hypothetical protein